MKTLPVSFFYDWPQIPNELLGTFFREFAANGAEKLVLSNRWVEQIIRNPRFYAYPLHHYLRESGLEFFETHAPYGEAFDLNCSSMHRREAMIQDHTAMMAMAAEYGCRTYVIHIGAWDCYMRPEITLESMRERTFDSLEKLLPAAEKAGIIIAIENSYELTNSPDELLIYLKHFDSPYLGCCFDVGHANIMAPAENGAPKQYDSHLTDQAWRGNPVQEPAAFEKLAPYIVTCHLHDNSGVSDDHDLPGRGTVDWQDVISKLKSAPKLISLQAEVDCIKNKVSINELCSTIKKLTD